MLYSRLLPNSRSSSQHQCSKPSGNNSAQRFHYRRGLGQPQDHSIHHNRKTPDVPPGYLDFQDLVLNGNLLVDKPNECGRHMSGIRRSKPPLTDGFVLNRDPIRATKAPKNLKWRHLKRKLLDGTNLEFKIFLILYFIKIIK